MVISRTSVVVVYGRRKSGLSSALLDMKYDNYKTRDIASHSSNMSMLKHSPIYLLDIHISPTY